MSDESSKKDDAELFQQAMRGVTPLKPDNRVRHRPAPRKPPQRPHDDLAGNSAERFSTDVLDESCPDHLYFERAGGIQKSVLKKLRGGKLPVDSVLDLHGLTIEQARLQLIDFIDECRQFDCRHVLIVHGKGFRSRDKPVIKPMVNRWLQQANEVLAFCSAQPKDGGTGAVYVLLRKTRDEGQGAR